MNVTNVGVNWVHFQSTSYPYSISQPSSFRHIVFQNIDGRSVDLFSPGLGSSTTGVSIFATVGRPSMTVAQTLRSRGGKKIHRSGWLNLAGQRCPLIYANFHAMIGRYTEEAVMFTAGGLTWSIFISYEPRYRSLRNTMLHMVQSFRLNSATPRRR